MNVPLPPDAALRAARQREAVAALATVLPAHALLWQSEGTTPYECDGLTAYRARRLVVALPETEAQVAAVLKACHELKLPVVARGAGTGLSGGALPNAMGVTLSLAKFNKILQVDRAARTATVQAGVRNLAISEAAAPYGLYYAPGPSSQIACTIGGNVAESAGGVHCLKYGLTLHNALRVRGLTVQGEPVSFGSEALDAPGLDLLPLVVGSEGMLAVMLKVTVKLVPKPQLARCIMASFDDIRKAGDAVDAIIAAGIIPAGLEMMDKPMTEAVEDYVHAGFGPHRPRLHVHGQHHPTQVAGRHSAGHRRHGTEVRSEVLQCLPRRRRQPAPVDTVRRQRPRPASPLRTLRCRYPGDQRCARRHRHRRARCGCGKAQQHVRAVQP